MRFPEFRFQIRTMLILIALIAAALGCLNLQNRWNRYKELAEYHAGRSKFYRDLAQMEAKSVLDMERQSREFDEKVARLINPQAAKRFAELAPRSSSTAELYRLDEEAASVWDARKAELHQLIARMRASEANDASQARFHAQMNHRFRRRW